MAKAVQAAVTATVEDGELVIRLPMNKTLVPSATGKTLVVASSRGNVETEVQVDVNGNARNVIVGVNAYVKR